MLKKWFGENGVLRPIIDMAVFVITIAIFIGGFSWLLPACEDDLATLPGKKSETIVVILKDKTEHTFEEAYTDNFFGPLSGYLTVIYNDRSQVTKFNYRDVQRVDYVIRSYQ